MARKKRKKEEEFHFKVPEFDQAEFMRKEIEGAKAAVITVGYALLISFGSYYLALLGVGYLAALLGFAALYGIKYLYPMLKLDTVKFDKKTWVGNGAIFLFAWLAFWVLLLNPPFLDISPPSIQIVEVPGADPVNLSPGDQAILSLDGNSSIEIRVKVLDNIRVAEVEITLVGGEPVLMKDTGEDGWFSHTEPDVQLGTLYVFEVVAFDHKGLESDAFTFGVTPS
ncbi:MAG: hypothetical protein LN412_08005 [Candidatus Thermoplasmatota archaeon]|nr:hypothetical protein [Candidatus Thermoplasmatota archaeon]